MPECRHTAAMVQTSLTASIAEQFQNQINMPTTTASTAEPRSSERPQQIKLDPNDPWADEISHRLIEFATGSGFLRGTLNLYLSGQITWRNALETMIILVMQEFRAQQQLTTEVIQENRLSLTNAPKVATLLLKMRRKEQRIKAKNKKTRKKREPKWFPEI